MLQFLFLFIIPIAFGEITINIQGKGVYNLGEKVLPSVSIKEDRDYDGFFNLHIFCDNYDLQYYAIPLNLEADFRTQLTVPELPLSRSMTTKCRLKANLEATDGERIDSAWSEYFFVTDRINITIDEDLEAKPGEDVVILGQVKKHSGEILPNGEAKITFKDEEEKVDVVSGKFEHTIHLEDNVEAGKISILIVVTDKYGNYGDKILKLNVLPIPTRIENRFENRVLMPGNIFGARVILYDHNSRIINGSIINIRVFNPDEKLVAEGDIHSSDYFEFETEKTQIPGSYFLLSTFEDIKEQSSFSIGVVREIVMKQEGNFVYVENVGNVEYEDEVTIILESDENKYLINKKIDLGAGEKITIDLSKEVPQGTYDIILPEETVEEPVAEDTNESGSQEVIGLKNVIEDVEIDDNRNVVKKIADGMSSITGAVVGAAGYVASKPLLASVVLVLIILGTITHYSWGFIKNRVRGKKEDSTDHIFEDFKYEGKSDDTEFEQNEDNKPGN